MADTKTKKKSTYPKKDARSQIIESIAKVCHQANKAYCETIGDDSQVDWELAPDWQKDSARNGVALHLDSDVGPSGSHKSWMKEKLADGWKFGETKDPKAKTHPCLVAFDKLSPMQQNKDILFMNIVKSFKGLSAQ